MNRLQHGFQPSTEHQAGPVVLIAAGGTGGHIFPGLSVAQALEAEGWQVHWAGNPSAMEGQLVPKHGLPLHPVVFAGFRGKGLLQQALMPLRLIKALLGAVRLIRALRPVVVLGMGGYVAFPVGLAARLLGIPLVVHEQNSVAGLTNRVLARCAQCVLEAFPGSLKNALCVGNPVRQAVLTQATVAQRFAGRTGPLRLLVLGGSLGAQALNSVLPQALSLLPADQAMRVVHQTGQAEADKVREHYQALGLTATVLPFIDNVAEHMACADVVVCRAGAMTVAEVAAIGVAALFVPYPHAVDDHQTHNALYLTTAKAAWLQAQPDLTPQFLGAWLQTLDRIQCEAVAHRAHALAKIEATQDVVRHLQRCAQA